MVQPARGSVLGRAALAFCLALALLAGSPVPGRLAAAQEAASAVQDVTLQDVVLGFGDTRITAPLVAASGTRLSKDELLAILKTDGKEPWAARLARLDAGSLIMPELRVESGDGEARRVSIYRDVRLKGVQAGRVAEITAAGASLSGEGNAKGSNGAIRAEDADLAGLARVYSEPGTDKGPLQRLYGAFSVSDIVFGDDEATLTIASLRGRELSGRRTPATWSGTLDALAEFDPDTVEPAERARLSGIAADFAEAVSVGGLEATGLSFAMTQDEPMRIGIGRLAYSGDGDAGLALSDIDLSVADARMSLAKLSLTGFSLAPTVAALRQLATNAEASGADLRRLTPVIGTLALSGFSLDLPGEDVKGMAAPLDAGKADPPGVAAPSPPPASSGDPLAEGGAKGGGKRDNKNEGEAKPAPGGASGAQRFGLREASLSFGPPKDGVPVTSRMAFAGLTLPAATVAGIPGLGALGSYGYRDLDLDLVADTAWNEGAKEMALREVSLSGKGMGTLRLSGTLGGIGPEVFDPDAGISSHALLAATAKALDLRIVNGGLYERFIDAQAKTLSLKPDELRKEYVTACLIGIPVILGNSAGAKTLGAAMGKFAAKPGTLSISAKARSGGGLGIADLSTAASPGAVLDKIDLSAKAE